MLPTIQLNDVIQGDSYTIPLSFSANGKPLKLPDWYMEIAFRLHPLAAPEFCLTSDLANNVVIFRLTPEKTRNLLPVTYHFDLRLKNPAGSVVSVVNGTMPVIHKGSNC